MIKRIIVFWVAWLCTLLFATLLALTPNSNADGLWELKEATVTYRSFFPGGTDPLITQNAYQPGKVLGKELDLTINTDVLDYLYWNNTVHSMTDDDPINGGGQFRMVGLEMGFGFDLNKLTLGFLPATVGYYHYSRHLLDTQGSLGHFPVEDSLELKLFLYKAR